MAFRRPEQDKSSPSLGYRLSSNRQPGVEIANNRMPSRPRPRFSPEDMPFPNPGQGRPAPMPRPMPMPMPGPMEPFRPPPGMNPMRPMMSRERQGISSLMPSNIGVDRGPTTMDPIMAMLNNPQVMRDFNYATDLENLQEDNIMNRLMIGEKFDPMIEAEELKRNPPYDGPSIMDILGGQEQAAVDPSDYRTIIKMIEQGLNPEDYMASSGIMNALPQETQIAELSKPQLDFMKSPMGTPDFYSNYQDYKDAVNAREEKPLFGIFGGQEPATDPEIINKLKETYGTIPFQVPRIV